MSWRLKQILFRSLLAVMAVLPLLTAPPVLSVGQDFPSFFDVAQKVGVVLMNVCGLADKDYIVEANGNGAAFFDYDKDGDMDLLIVNGSTLKTYRNGGDTMAALYQNTGGHFVDVTRKSGITRTGWGMGVCAADYDNDGNQDFYLTAYGPNVLYRNNGAGTFADVSVKARVSGNQWSTNCAFGDYNRDGYVDLYVANYVRFDETTIPPRGKSEKCRYVGAPVFCGPQGLVGEPDVLYRNNGDGTFTFRLEGTRSNRDAIGARVEIDAGGRTQVAEVQSGGSYLSSNDIRIHFGLGDATRVDHARIRWPNSPVEELAGFEAGHFVTVREGRGVVSAVP